MGEEHEHVNSTRVANHQEAGSEAVVVHVGRCRNSSYKHSQQCVVDVNDALKQGEVIMSESKHTPGPWEVMGGVVVTRSENGQLIDVSDCCTGAASVKDPFTIAANARLIAAAPDLLKVLRMVAGGRGIQCGPECHSYRGPCDCGAGKTMAAVKAVIIKAVQP